MIWVSRSTQKRIGAITLTPGHVWQEEDQSLVVQARLLIATPLHTEAGSAAFEPWVGFTSERVQVESLLERPAVSVIAAVRF
jgi:hypothetical protein